MGSRQFLEEWQLYKKVLDDSKVTQKTTWLDVRGNHGKGIYLINPKATLYKSILVT